jgi:hypothetical protein
MLLIIERTVLHYKTEMKREKLLIAKNKGSAEKLKQADSPNNSR